MSLDDVFSYNEENYEEFVQEEKKEYKIEDAVYHQGEKNNGIGIAAIGFSKNGKSLMGSLLPWLNQKYWTSSPNKEGKYIKIDNYPLTKEMITTGLIPEVSELRVIDLDGSYDSKSKIGIFGRLTSKLYEDKKIFITTIDVPDRKAKAYDKTFREVAKIDIDLCKLKLDNEIKRVVTSDDETVALMIDPFEEIERLLNNKFRIMYEEEISPVRPLKDGTTKEYYGSSLDGIPMKFWYIRNSWFEDTLRQKRKYKGYCYDTFKIDLKDDEIGYKICWTKKSHYFFDLILWFDTSDYTAKVINRFKSEQDRQKPVDFTKCQEIKYTARKPYAIYELFEALAPSIMGMVEKDGEYIYDDIYE